MIEFNEEIPLIEETTIKKIGGKKQLKIKIKRKDRFEESKQGGQGKLMSAFPELSNLNFLEVYQKFFLPIQEFFNKRRMELGLWKADVSANTKISAQTINRFFNKIDGSSKSGISFHTIFAISKALSLNIRIELIDAFTNKTYQTIHDDDAIKLIERRLNRFGSKFGRIDNLYYKETIVENIEKLIEKGLFPTRKDMRTLLVHIHNIDGERKRLKEWLSVFLTESDSAQATEVLYDINTPVLTEQSLNSKIYKEKIKKEVSKKVEEPEPEPEEDIEVPTSFINEDGTIEVQENEEILPQFEDEEIVPSSLEKPVKE